jgi:hypothetical protein
MEAVEWNLTRKGLDKKGEKQEKNKERHPAWRLKALNMPSMAANFSAPTLPSTIAT